MPSPRIGRVHRRCPAIKPYDIENEAGLTKSERVTVERIAAQQLRCDLEIGHMGSHCRRAPLANLWWADEPAVWFTTVPSG